MASVRQASCWPHLVKTDALTHYTLGFYEKYAAIIPTIKNLATYCCSELGPDNEDSPIFEALLKAAKKTEEEHCIVFSFLGGVRRIHLTEGIAGTPVIFVTLDEGSRDFEPTFLALDMSQGR